MITPRNERGASAVEFALVLPLLILFLFGIIEFGFILYDKAVITNASREGARKGIIYDEDESGAAVAVSEAEIQSMVDTYCGSYLVSLGNSASMPTTVVTPSGACLTKGNALTVTVTYPYTFLVLPDFGTNITLNAVTVMNCENQ